jgi:hypothetical protein
VATDSLIRIVFRSQLEIFAPIEEAQVLLAQVRQAHAVAQAVAT